MKPIVVEAPTARRHWERLALRVRCALEPTRPAAIGEFVAAGLRLSASGGGDVAALQRVLTVLFQTAHDEALPWAWRSACVEHTARPIARLTSRLAATDPQAGIKLDIFVQYAIKRLGPPPSRATVPAAGG